MGMRVAIAVFLILVFGLWLFSGIRSQRTVGGDEATVQANLTAVLKPTPTATP